MSIALNEFSNTRAREALAVAADILRDRDRERFGAEERPAPYDAMIVQAICDEFARHPGHWPANTVFAPVPEPTLEALKRAKYVPITESEVPVIVTVPADQLGPYFTSPIVGGGVLGDITHEWTGVPQDSESKPDLPHPGISDEFWEKVPEKDRESFSAFLVRQEAGEDPLAETDDESTEPTKDAPEPEGLFGLPEITASRGGLSFSGGWCAPGDTIYDVKPLTKKELRRQVKRLSRALAQARKQRNEIERDLRRARKVIRRLTR